MRAISLFLLLLTLCFLAKAQEKTWKRRVSRTIDIREKDHGENTHYSILSGILFESVKAGKIRAYKAFDNNFATIMTPQEFAIHCEQRDTFYLYDSITKTTLTKVLSNTFLPDSIYQYRIFEEWTFEPASGKLVIQIEFVAPLRNVYGEEGNFRGRQPLFWLSYHDFSGVMEVNDIHQIQPFYRCLWQSNFDTEVRPLPVDNYFDSKTGLWFANAITTMDMQETPDTVLHFLRNENGETSLSENIISEFKNGKILAWTGYDELLSPQFTQANLKGLANTPIDTFPNMIDPVTGNDESIQVIRRDFNYESMHNYTLLQSWSFNSITGKTDVELKTVAPARDIYHDDDGTLLGTKPMFWIRYSDLQPILSKVEQYHPTNTFAMHIWDNFFLSDKKPELQK